MFRIQGQETILCQSGESRYRHKHKTGLLWKPFPRGRVNSPLHLQKVPLRSQSKVPPKSIWRTQEHIKITYRAWGEAFLEGVCQTWEQPHWIHMHIGGAPRLTFPNIYTPALLGTVEAMCKYDGMTYKLLGRVAWYPGPRNLHHTLHPQEKAKCSSAPS